MNRVTWLSFGLWLAVLAASHCTDGPNPPPPEEGARIISFVADPTHIHAGQFSTLRWNTVGNNGVAIEPAVGLEPPVGSAEVRPLATTTYTLTILTLTGETVSGQATVFVEGGPPRIERFFVTPRTIQAGETARLEWVCKNVTKVSIDNGIGEQPATGSFEVRPSVTTTYKLTAKSDVGSTSQDTTVVVSSGNQPFIRLFTATPQSVAPGDPVTLNWETMNADLVTISPGVGSQAPNGSILVHPTNTTVYTLDANGPGGTARGSVTVDVTAVGNPVVLRFSISPPAIAPGATATMTWETDRASGVLIEPDVGPQAAKGSTTVGPSKTTTYRLTAFGTTKNATASATLVVTDPNTPTIASFLATPAAIVEGGSTTLSWSTQNADAVDIAPGVGTNLATTGSIQVSPTQTTRYTLTARGPSASATASLEVSVAPLPPAITSFVAQPMSVVRGNAATLSWQTARATSVNIDQGLGMQPTSGSIQVRPTQATRYTLTAVGPGGQTTAFVVVDVAAQGAPVISRFVATPQQITAGAEATLSWETADATSVRIDNGVGAVALIGETKVTPAQTTSYTLTAEGPGGTATARTTIVVAAPNGDQCASAIEIRASGTFTGNTQTAVDDYFESTLCTGYLSHGPDQVYRVALAAQDRFTATLTPGTGWDASLYLVSACENIGQSCVAGEDNGGPETVDYRATAAGTYFLIVDGYGTGGGAYTLDVVINPAPIANDRCDGAIDVGRGGTFNLDTRFAQNDVDPGSTGCTRFAEAGNDVAYRVTLAQGERLLATLDAAWDAALYLVRDCANAQSTCATGSDRGNPETISFTAQSAATYFLIVDGWERTGGAATLTVSVSPPVLGGETCASPVQVPAGGGVFASTTQGLANDVEPPGQCTGYAQNGPDRVYAIPLGRGDVLEASTTFASTLDGSLYVLTDCTSGAACVAGRDVGDMGEPEQLRLVARQSTAHHIVVDASRTEWSGAHELTLATYTGDTCASAPPLLKNATAEWLTTEARTNNYSPNAGGCTSGISEGGPDRAYRVVLAAGDQLRATLTPEGGWDPALYIVGNCQDISASCLAGTDAPGSAAEDLSVVVQQGGTYYVIVDAFSTAPGSGTITATVSHGDSCSDAYRVKPARGTYVFRGTTAGYRAELGANDGPSSCTGWAQSGPDAVYMVTLARGQQLRASLTSTWDAALYLVSNCNASATTCLEGSDSGNPEEIQFTNSTATNATVHLVVDSWRTSDFGNYTLEVIID